MNKSITHYDTAQTVIDVATDYGFVKIFRIEVNLIASIIRL